MSDLLNSVSGAMGHWAALLPSVDAPALPATWLMRPGLTLGWALLLALLGAALAWRLSLQARRWLAAALALWALLPGPLTPDYWLGLAFHAPSLTAMLLSAWWLQRLLFPAASGPARSLFVKTSNPGAAAVWLLPAVLLGYALLLDTFAVLPLQIYGWGFSPLLLLVLLALSLLPWLVKGSTERDVSPARWLLPATLLLFAATRLPTGNLWDALLDPWLWLVLQLLLLRGLYRSLRGG